MRDACLYYSSRSSRLSSGAEKDKVNKRISQEINACNYHTSIEIRPNEHVKSNVDAGINSRKFSRRSTAGWLIRYDKVVM